jgi:protein TonB
MTACSKQEAAPSATPQPTPPAAVVAGVAESGGQDRDALALSQRADQALREQRLLLPPGDNAFELLLAALEADPGNPITRTALADLLPYAVLHVEQQTAAGDDQDASRTLALILRADPQAPSVPRLQRGLDALRASQALAATRLAAPASAPATLPSPVAVQAPIETAPPAAAAPLPSAAPAPMPTPTPTEPVASTTAQVSAAATTTPAAVAPLAMPDVVFRPALRYPPMAERRRIEGEVEVEFTINVDGSVSEVRVLRSQPEGIFDREASGAMERWRFAPPEQPMRARRVLEFKLSG